VPRLSHPRLRSPADPDAADAVSAASSPAATETVPALDPALLLAKSYFDAKEYRRCAHVLRDAAVAPSSSSSSTSSAPPSWHAVFLRGYALFMAGEKQKEEEIFEAKGASQSLSVVVCVRGLWASCVRVRGLVVSYLHSIRRRDNLFSTTTPACVRICLTNEFAILLVAPPSLPALRPVARRRWCSLSRRGRIVATRRRGDQCRRLGLGCARSVICGHHRSLVHPAAAIAHKQITLV
jgi:hypothetical protein